MDFNGNVSGATTGSINDITPPSGLLTVDGDCKVTGDLDVLGTIVGDINVTDALIAYNRNAPADTFNQGIYGNSNANTAFSGLVRNRTDKAFYLFNLSSTAPSALSTIADRNGMLKLGTLDAIGASVGAVGAQYALPSTTVGAVAQDSMIYNGAGVVSFAGVSQLRNGATIRAVVTATGTALTNEAGTSGVVLDDSLNGGTVSFVKGSAGLLMNSMTTSVVSSTSLADALTWSGAGVNNVTVLTRNGVGLVYANSTAVKHSGTANGDYLEFTATTATIAINSITQMSIAPSAVSLFCAGGSGLTLTTSDSSLYSPGSQSIFTLADGGFNCQIAGWYSFVADSGAGSAYLQAPNNDSGVYIDNTQINMTVSGGAKVFVDVTESALRSPNLSTYCKVTDALFQINSAGSQVVIAGSGQTQINAQGSAVTFAFLNNTSGYVTVNSVQRLYADTTQSLINSPSAVNGLLVDNTKALLRFSSVERIKADATGSTVFSPNQTTFVTAVDSSVQIAVAGASRIISDATSSRLQSPNVAQVLSVANTGVTFNTGANSNLLPTGRGSAGQALLTDGAGVTSWSSNVAWSGQWGGNVSSAALRWLPTSGTATIGSDIALSFLNEMISPFACTARWFTWASSNGDATTAMTLYVSGAVAGTIALTGAVGRVAINIAVADAGRVAVAWNPTGGGTRPVQMTCMVGFA